MRNGRRNVRPFHIHDWKPSTTSSNSNSMLQHSLRCFMSLRILAEHGHLQCYKTVGNHPIQRKFCCRTRIGISPRGATLEPQAAVTEDSSNGKQTTTPKCREKSIYMDYGLCWRLYLWVLSSQKSKPGALLKYVRQIPKAELLHFTM